MASCNFGASSVKVSNLNLGSVGTKLGALGKLHVLTSQTAQKFPSLLIANPFGKASIRFKCLSQTKEETISKLEDDTEKEEASGAISPLIPNAYEVEALVNQICDTSSIAEFELKLGGFRLHVTRNLTVESKTLPPPVSAPVNVNTTAEAPSLNGSASTPSLAITKPAPASSGIQTFLDKAGDEGIVILQSPRVGYFRRSRTIKGKKAPPPCKEKQAVKEGQVLCYIEQLGGEIPIESDISGEVIKILREDGDPVGYGDALIAILPSFPGIKKLQ